MGAENGEINAGNMWARPFVAAFGIPSKLNTKSPSFTHSYGWLLQRSASFVPPQLAQSVYPFETVS